MVVRVMRRVRYNWVRNIIKQVVGLSGGNFNENFNNFPMSLCGEWMLDRQWNLSLRFKWNWRWKNICGGSDEIGGCGGAWIWKVIGKLTLEDDAGTWTFALFCLNSSTLHCWISPLNWSKGLSSIGTSCIWEKPMSFEAIMNWKLAWKCFISGNWHDCVCTICDVEIKTGDGSRTREFQFEGDGEICNDESSQIWETPCSFKFDVEIGSFTMYCCGHRSFGAHT